MMTHDKATQSAGELAAALRQYRGTDYHAALLKLFEAVKISYMHQFIEMPAASPRFADMQGAAKQMAALERALGGETDTSPLI